MTKVLPARARRRSYVPWLAFILFAALLLLLPTLLHTAFGQVSVSYLSLATNALTLAILALSWDILARTGQLSLAHAAFYGAGAYTVAILGRLTEWPLGIGIPVGGLVAVLLALFLGSVTLRLKGYLFRYRYAVVYRGAAGGRAAAPGRDRGRQCGRQRLSPFSPHLC